jgi:transcriptional regulator with XRE-family HTH domain
MRMESRAAIERVRGLMTYRAVTQRELATALGWDESRVSRVLNCKNSLDVDDLGAICRFFGLTLPEFYAGKLPSRAEEPAA